MLKYKVGAIKFVNVCLQINRLKANQSLNIIVPSVNRRDE